MNTSKQGERMFLYYGLLAYTVVFYSQIGTRFPVLNSLRIEFLLGSLLLLIIFVKLLTREITLKENRMNIAALIFLFSAFLTIPFAFVKQVAFNGFIHLLKFFAIYFMIISAINSEQKLKGFILVYLALISLLFVEPFVLSLQGKGYIYNNGMLRLAGITGYFSHPNQLGGITSENLPFFYFFMKYEKSIVIKIVFAILIVIALYVIMLTQSRTAFVGVLTVGFLIWVFSEKKLWSLIIILILLIVSWQFAPQQTRERFLTLGSTLGTLKADTSDMTPHEKVDSGSMTARWELINRGFIAFKENPILGLGLRCFPSFNGRRWGYWFPPHNTYLQALAEMGIIGFSAFLFVIISTFNNLHRSRKLLTNRKTENPFLFYMSNAVTIYFITRLVVAMFGQDLYENYWWVAGGLSLVMLRICNMKLEEYKQNCTINSIAR